MGVTNSYLEWERIYRERGWQEAQNYLFTLKGGIRKQVLELIANERTVRNVEVDSVVDPKSWTKKTSC
jgi:hypothetical protein